VELESQINNHDNNSDFDNEGETPLAGLESFVPGFMRDRRNEINSFLGKGQSLDLVALQKTAHQWKGFSEPYGFKTLGLLAQELELKAKAGDYAECNRILAQIDQYLLIKEQKF
jgi:HPt (histidine-containing phosphotransfer) domain-containing protein